MTQRPIFVQLGRLGDILNVLPLLELPENHKYGKPYIMVQREFAGVLTGISYAEPLIWDGHWELLNPAVAHARTLSTDVRVSQIYGRDFRLPEHRTPNFMQESHLQCGVSPWNRYPLTFDRQDRTRSAALYNSIRKTTLPLILVFSKDFSSPVRYDLYGKVKELYPFYEVVDMSNVMSEQIYDLIYTMERACLIFCSDSAPYHLTRATRTPVVQLVESDIWARALPYHNVIQRFYYHQIPTMPRTDPEQRIRLIHAVDVFNPDTRKLLAHKNWENEYATGRWRHIPKFQATRYAENDKVPLIGDIVEHAIKYTGDTDIVVLTNDDVHFVPNFTENLLTLLPLRQAVFTHRWDVSTTNITCIADIKKLGHWYTGSDCFAFTKAWWNSSKQNLEKLAIGRECWDCVFRNEVKRTGGVELPFSIFHERHASHWLQGNNRTTLPGNVANRKIMLEYLKRYNLLENDWTQDPNVNRQNMPSAQRISTRTRIRIQRSQ